jgi:nucleotide-binding universal stress UspA family protein
MTSRDHVVVVGVDGSAASVAALRHALSQVDDSGTDVEVVTAWSGSDTSRESRHAARRDALKAQVTTVARARRQVDVPVRISAVLVEGHPDEVLLGASQGANRLVLGAGTLQPGRLHRACLRRATCPVLLVPSGDREPARAQPVS